MSSSIKVSGRNNSRTSLRAELDSLRRSSSTRKASRSSSRKDKLLRSKLRQPGAPVYYPRGREEFNKAVIGYKASNRSPTKNRNAAKQLVSTVRSKLKESSFSKKDGPIGAWGDETRSANNVQKGGGGYSAHKTDNPIKTREMAKSMTARKSSTASAVPDGIEITHAGGYDPNDIVTRKMLEAKLNGEKHIKVRDEKLQMMASSLFPKNKTPDYLQWSTEMNGIRSYNHLLKKDAWTASHQTMTHASVMEMENALCGTSFGNRARVMPENDTRPGDNAWQGGETHPHVSHDAYSSSLVKDIIFSGVDSNRFR